MFMEQDTRLQAFHGPGEDKMPQLLVFTAFLLLYTTYYGTRHAVTSVC